MKKLVVSLILVQDGKVLLGINKKHNQLCTPGGKVEDGEGLTSAVRRETKEEIGITLDRIWPMGFAELEDKIIFTYYCKKWSGDIVNCEPDKHGDWAFMLLHQDLDMVPGLHASYWTIRHWLYNPPRD